MYRSKLNVYKVMDLKLFPKLLSGFIANVLHAVVKSDNLELKDFKITVDQDQYAVYVDSTDDFEDIIDEFNIDQLGDLDGDNNYTLEDLEIIESQFPNTFGLDFDSDSLEFEYSEIDEAQEVSAEMHAKYNLDLQGLRSHKMLSLLISDFITSVHRVFMYEEYRGIQRF